ncbi:protein JOKA2-like isoform X2 [Macadamia integrifolia]|uniref:protein JOKA2-like isoform X2 n=1 Tax=Macadamia integrifolia TaxID=60698 RepID=UPI001C50133F|nr:protein JOKA2-like isoform X2 [Macadamia integrifolia]
MPDLVIKVKYADTLRRFSVDVQEDGSMDLNMTLLMAKILNLFKFAPDADLNLTYIDEDRDIVTLVDDDDLQDAFRQCLNPLRINILLNSTRNGRYDTRSSGSSTPMRSPFSLGPSFPNINSGVTEVLKPVPEPFRDALSMLSYDLAAKTSSSVPVVTELVEFLSKLGLNNLNSVHQCNDGAHSSAQGVASENPVEFRVAEDLESLKKLALVQNAKVANAKLADDNKECDSRNVTRVVGTSVPKSATSVDLNLDPRDSITSGFSAAGLTVPTALGHNDVSVNGKDIQKKHNGNLSGKSVASVTPFYTFSDRQVHFSPQPYETSNSAKLPFSAINTQGGSSVLGGDSNKQLPTGFRYSSVSQVDFNPQSKCPFRGQSGVESSDVVAPGGHSSYHPSKRSGRIFHKGVRCDGCWVYPITGPRYKSKVKEDYDLCSICYSELGNKDEYIRMDRPMPCRSPRLFKKHYDRPGCGVKPCRSKLDSCFVEDVNVFDGTVMAPETPFTKIWRVRNSGTVAWPRGTHLVWIGGDQFSDKVLVELEIPVDGIPVDKVLDVAVDFRAPQHPGCYVSYWRMASPSGQKFGQQVWVLIQVDASSQEGSIASSFHSLNLNLPPECSGAKGSEIVDVNAEPADSNYLESGCVNLEMELVRPVVDKHPSKDQALEYPVNDSLLVGSGVSVPVNPGIPASVSSYPMIDFSEGFPEPSPMMDVETLAGDSEADVENVEKTLLKELEDMGFKQNGLNKEILRMNEYNMEQSLDYLCGVVEWDPILEELQDMGFHDKETNKKLLIKNGGSIKRVVMDLIADERRLETSPPAL